MANAIDRADAERQALVTQLKNEVQDELSTRVPLLSGNVDDDVIRGLIRDVVNEKSRAAEYLPIPEPEIGKLITRFSDDFLGYGPLQPLLADPDVSEIMVNGGGFDEDGNMLPHEVWVEKNGKLILTDVRFESEEHVVRVMNRIAATTGRHLDSANPIEDAALKDGSRFNGTLFPAAKDGSTMNIRKFQQNRLTYRDMVASGTLTIDELEFLATAVASRCSILISGGTGSGKTTMLNMLSGFVPSGERIITIEDTCELLVHKSHPHVVRFESRKPNSEGKGEITLNDHLVAALRKRPDRIIVGECRGPEAYTMLEAMNTGHEGSMSTIHANDAQAALIRLMTLVKQGDSTLSEDTIWSKIAQAIDLVVQVQRKSDGRRVVTEIMAVGNYQEGTIQHDMLFEFDQKGLDESGHVVGEHRACGTQPAAIMTKIREAGYDYKLEWMQEG